MVERRCLYCQQVFQPSKLQPRQAVCGGTDCQCRRRTEYHRKKLTADPESPRACVPGVNAVVCPDVETGIPGCSRWGAYVVKPADLPLYQIDLDGSGRMVLKSLPAGVPRGSTTWKVLADSLPGQ